MILYNTHYSMMGCYMDTALVEISISSKEFTQTKQEKRT
jgi:hypothetical protein